MADIRINALATTAASTASDDFIAVDGSANGTRKLDAYSPTFGGNLTVSGTGTIGSNLTVSGTGTSTFNGPVTVANTASTGSYQTGLRLQSALSTAPNTVQSLEFYSSSLGAALGAVDALREGGSFAGSLRFWSTTGPGTLTEGARLTSGGNILIGTTTDGGQKLQVNGDATFAGNVTASGSGDRLATVETTGSSNAAVLRLKSGNGTTSAQYAYLQLISNETSGQTWNVGMYNEKQFSIRDGGTPFLTIANSTGNATFAGSIAINNTVNTVSPTSPNRTITMVIGGTTYYIHAKTTND